MRATDYTTDHHDFVATLQSLGTFEMHLECTNYLFACVPDAIALQIREAIATHFGEEALHKTPEHWHVTMLFPKFDGNTPNHSLQHACEAFQVHPPKNKKDKDAVNLCMETFQGCFPSITVRFGDMCLVTNDGELATIDVHIDSIGFPHEPHKIYHITLWSNRKVAGRQPFCSNLLLMDAKTKR